MRRASSTISGSTRVVVVGTSRGGLIAMVLGGDGEGRGWPACSSTTSGRSWRRRGSRNIMSYLGIAPRAQTYAEAAAALRARMGERFPGARRTRSG